METVYREDERRIYNKTGNQLYRHRGRGEHVGAEGVGRIENGTGCKSRV